MSSANPDWSVLVPLGHWTKHRNRPDLLTHVLVASSNGLKSIPVDEALLADRYVEHGRDRQRLFPAVPVIAADYIERDPKGSRAHKWRDFFEKAGAKGAPEVQRVTAPPVLRSARRIVAQFLDCDVDNISESNDDGYELLDFEIKPDLPSPDAPEELRKALAAWLADGRNVLKGTGRRQARYFYYGPKHLVGAPSDWVAKLSELAWVPSDDAELRCPREVLPQSNPAQENAPVARLSSSFLAVLKEEGIEFGSAIPEATSLQLLMAAGSRLNAGELAQVLRKCREQVSTDKDRGHFNQALRDLTVPSSDDQRVPLDRVVKRVGGGRLRGALSGWVVPLDRIEDTLRAELEHSDFPREFPDTTTGGQALDYIRDVWRRTQSSSEGLANEVRDMLPAAYAYCLEDCAKDALLSERWRATTPEAAVFVEREWVVLTETNDIYFDNIENRRFFPGQVQLRTVTGGHLGRTRSEQIRTAEAIGLPLLSSSVEMEWHGENHTLQINDDWVSKFALICQLLRQVRRNERVESDGKGIEIGSRLELIRVHALALDVSIGSAPAERVPVNARLQNDVLTVSGRPVQFGADAAKELLRHFSFGQRGDLAADLTGMLSAIDNPSDFNLAADKFRRSFAPEFELSARKTDKSRDESDTSRNDEPSPTGGSFTKESALARQNALLKKLKNSLEGEIAPSDNGDDSSEATNGDGTSGAELGDEEYRRAAAQYEKKSGREPELGDPLQEGWDIRSIDPETGVIRVIEVKGKGRAWFDNEVVELSRAQIRKAFEASVEQTESWYLYVVEKTGEGEYQVLPIENPVRIAAKWMLCGEAWRTVAEAEIRRDGDHRAEKPSRLAS